MDIWGLRRSQGGLRRTARLFLSLTAAQVVAATTLTAPALAEPEVALVSEVFSPQKSAYDAYQAGDFQTAMVLWSESARMGDAHAQYNLGHLYAEGKGIKRNPYTAQKWWLAAAKQGHTRAQHNLGMALLAGESLIPGAWNEPNVDEALKWIGEAASAGLAESQNVLGTLYRTGFGIEEDDGAAIGYFRSAAEQGLGDAQVNLAKCFRDGAGVKADVGAAVAWLLQAAGQGNVMAQEELGNMYLADTSEQADTVEAYYWMHLAAVSGSIAAQARLTTLQSVMDPAELEAAIARINERAS